MGTFIVAVLLATGSVVFYAKMNRVLDIPFISFALFVGAEIGMYIYLFCKISMILYSSCNFGFSNNIVHTKGQLLLYIIAEIISALLVSLFVKYVIGRGIQASPGFNPPIYSYPLPSIFAVEVLASALLMMAIIFLLVYIQVT